MIKKIISNVKKYWWISISIIIILWGIYLVRNCHLWPGNNCTGFIGKTLWDVLELVIIPITIVGVAAFLERLERKTDREIANKRAEFDREISKDNQQEGALQNFFDVMTRLLLEYKLRESKEDNEVRTIAQAKTISTLKTLDINRKNKLLNFLCLLGLLDNDIILDIGVCIPLEDAFLDGCDFSNMNLLSAKFKSAHLEGANFEKADIQGCDFHSANLRGAILQWADLKSSCMEFAQLQEANLVGAHLEYVSLQDANLQDANLERAHLKGAHFLRANLKGAQFKGAIMPDGKEYDSSIHTIEFLTGVSDITNHE